jgi:polyisoprenoid-binding protein YceI
MRRHWHEIDFHFAAVQGMIRMDEADPSTVFVDVTLGVASIDTQQADRDSHLRSTDFFDVARFPTITLRSRRVQGNPLEGDFRLIGGLTIRDITREVTLDVSAGGHVMDQSGEERAGFSAQTKIDRTDFGLTWNQALAAGGVLVGNEARISVEVELVRQATQVAA